MLSAIFLQEVEFLKVTELFVNLSSLSLLPTLFPYVQLCSMASESELELQEPPFHLAPAILNDDDCTVVNSI